MEVDLDSSFENLERFKANAFEENSLLNELYEELYSKSRLSFDQFDDTEDGRNSAVDSNKSNTPSDNDDADISKTTKEEKMQKSGIPTKSSPCKIPRREGSPSAMESGEKSSPSGIPVRIPTRSPSASPTMLPRGIPRKGSTSSSGSSTRNSARNSREGSPSGIPTRGSPRLSRDANDDMVASSPRRSSAGIPTRTSSGIPKKTSPGSPRTSGIPLKGSPVLSGIPRKSGRTEGSVSYDSDDSCPPVGSPRDSGFHTEEHTASEFDAEQPRDSPSKIPSGIPMRTSRFSSPSHSRNQSVTSGASENEYREFASGLPVKESGVDSDPGTSTPKHQLSREIYEGDAEHMDVAQEEQMDVDNGAADQASKAADAADDDDDGSQSGDSQMQSSVIIHSSCSEDEDMKSGSSLLYGKHTEQVPDEDYSLLSTSKPAPVDQVVDQYAREGQLVDISNDDTYERKYEEKSKTDEISKKTSPLEGYIYRPYGQDVEDEPISTNKEESEEFPFKPKGEVETVDHKAIVDAISENKTQTEQTVESVNDANNEEAACQEMKQSRRQE